MKQNEFRDPNRRCLCCASPQPRDATRTEDLDHTQFNCPKCDDLLLSRITTTGDEAVYPTHLWIPRALVDAVSSGAINAERATKIDMYWTAAGWSIAINGRHVKGDRRITEFAANLESL